MGEVKQTNFRIDQDTADAFRKFCEENGWNQAEGFDNVMRQVELNKAKTATPGRAIEIETFEKSVKDIMTAYLNSIEINNNAEARIREQFATAIDSKDKTISDLQAKTAELQDAKTTAEQTAASAAQAAAQAVKDEEAAREQADTATKLAAEKDKTISTLADKLSIAEEKAAGYDELKKSEEQAQITITGLKKDIETLSEESARKLDAAKVDADREIELLKKEHTREINGINKDHETAIRELTTEMERKVSDAKKDAALSLVQAVTDKEREMNEQLREADRENAKLQAKIEALEARINELTAKN